MEIELTINDVKALLIKNNGSLTIILEKEYKCVIQDVEVQKNKIINSLDTLEQILINHKTNVCTCVMINKGFVYLELTIFCDDQKEKIVFKFEKIN